MKKLLIALVAFALISAVAFGAWAGTGTVVITRQPITDNVYYIKFAWISASNVASDTYGDGVTEKVWPGYLMFAITDPGTTPTASYDITITDAYSADVMGGVLADRSNSTTEQAHPNIGSGYDDRYVHGTLTLNVSAAGDAKTGDVYLYIRRDR